MSDSNQVEQNPNAASTSTQAILFMVVLLLAIGVAVYVRRFPVSEHPAVGKPAPRISLVKLPATDTTVDDWSQLENVTGQPTAGNVTILHFWGTWCPPCRAEYPDLVAMLQGYQANPRIDFLSVTCGPSGSEPVEELWASTSKFYEANQIGELTTYSDPTFATQQAAVDVLAEPGMLYPTTMIIGPDNRIAGVWLGYDENALAKMKSLIDELLAKLS